jgi:hypothetical protein
MEDEIIVPSFEIRDKPYSESELRQIKENISKLASQSLKEWNEKENVRFAKEIAKAKELERGET